MSAPTLDPTALPAEPLGPDSILWQVTGDNRAMLLAGRALVFQTAYPAVGAGVGEHSVYKTDPYGRLERTLQSVMAQVYGGARAAEEGRRLREMHREIKGVDSKGRRYSALHPEAYLWVHATTFEVTLVFLERFGTPLRDGQVQQLFDEWRRVGLLLGIKDQHLPRTLEEFWVAWDAVLAKLEDNEVVQDLLHNAPPAPPGLPVPDAVFAWLLRPLLKLRRDIIVWTVPAELAARFGLAPLTPREERRLRRVAALSRLAGRVLPEALLVMPLARRARAAGLADRAAAS